MTDVLVGRDEPLAQLCELLGRQEGEIALISGEPGVGKTRLVSEALGRTGINALVGTSSPASLGRPFDLLRSAVEPAVRSWVSLPAALTGVAGALAQLLRSVAPAIAGEHRGEPPAPAELIGAGIALVRHLDPALVVLEDLHWADVESLQVIERIVSSPEQPVLIGTYRPEELNAQHPAAELLRVMDGRHGPLHIHLEPFDLDEVHQFVSLALGGRGLDHRLVDQLHSRTGGSPFFLEEILSHSGSDTLELDSRTIPRTLTETIRLQIDELADDDRELLAIASVLGSRFDFDLLQAALGVDERTLITRLRQVVDRRILVEPEVDEFAFRHELVREAILGSLLGRERRRLHDQAFLALREQRPDDYAELARHAEGSRRIQDLVALAPRGVQHYLDAGSTYQALVLAEQALSEMPDHPELCRLAARAAWLMGELDAARRHARRWHAIEERAGSGREVEALGVIGRLAFESRDADTENAVVAEMEGRLACIEPGPDRARILAALAQLHMLNGRDGVAVSCADEAIALAEEHGLDDVRRVAVVERGSALMCSVAGIDEGRQVLQKVAKECEAAGDYVAAARAWHNLMLGTPSEEAERILDAMRAAAQRSGYDSMAVHYYAIKRVELAIAQGDLRQAMLWAGRPRLGGREAVSGAELAMLEVLLALEAGADEQAAQVLDELGFPAVAKFDQAAWTMAARMVLRARDGDLDGVRSSLGTLERSASLPVVLGWALRDLLAAGLDPTEILAVVDDARPDDPRPFLGVRAALAAATGHPDAAALLDQALDDDREVWPNGEDSCREDGAPHHLALVLSAELQLARAKCALDAGDTELAARLAEASAEALANWPGARRDDALALASRGRGGSTAGSELTGRELDVARLVARGMTNGEIAQQLYISRKTVSTHVSHILAKLGMASRTEVAAWAVREGLAGTG